MGFGSLIRSLSSSSRRSEGRYKSQSSHKASGRRHSFIPNADGAAAAFYRAKQIYEEEETQIMREQLRMRCRNDLECKRHMEMLEKQRRAEKRKLDDLVVRNSDVAVANYRAGKTSARELERSRQRDYQAAEVKWASYMKRYRSEQEKAQRIFFSRGEELGVNAGAALRRAKEKMERSQRIRV